MPVILAVLFALVALQVWATDHPRAEKAAASAGLLTLWLLVVTTPR